MTKMNFSWLIKGELSGHGAPMSEQDLLWLKEQGISALVRMAETEQARVISFRIQRLGLEDCHEPVPDFTAPKQVQISKMVSFIKKNIGDGKRVGVSCTQGLGRTGTILACYLVSKGSSSESAINEVRAKRPGSIETPEQIEAIRIFAAGR